MNFPIGIKNTFLLGINEQNHPQDNTYSTTYRFLKNSGSLKINNNELLPGNTITIEKENVCEYIPSQYGKASIEFIISDKYHTIRKDTAEFFVERSVINTNISNYTRGITLSDEQNIQLSVSKIGEYTGKYKLQIIQEAPSDFKIKVNGSNYQGGKIDIINSDNTLISFIPLKPGITKLVINVHDDFENYITKELDFEVKNSLTRVIIANNNTNLKLHETASFNFAIAKPNYSGIFQFEIIHSGKFANILVDGKSYQGGRVDVKNINNTLVQITPVVTGSETLNLNIYDEFGSIISENLTYNINNTNISVEIASQENKLILGKKTSFTFKASKPNYSENLYYELKMVPEKGYVKVGGSLLSPGKHPFLPGQDILCTFTPEEEGQAIINLIISDDFGAENKQSIVYSISNPPIQLTIQDYLSEATINTKNSFYLSAKKDQYTGDFKCKITTIPQDAGTIKINNTDYQGGNVSLDEPNNTLVSFIPKIAGDIAFTVSVYDTLGGSTAKTLTYSVINPPVLVTVSNQNHNIKVNENTTFNFAISKHNYNGVFQFEILQEPHPFGEILVNGTKYTGGKQNVQNINNTLVQFSPEVIGNVELLLIIYDEWGNVKKTKLPVSISNTDIEISTNSINKNLILNTPSTFSFSAKKTNYNGELNYSLELHPIDAGIISVNGQPYLPQLGRLRFVCVYSLFFFPGLLYLS